MAGRVFITEEKQLMADTGQQMKKSLFLVFFMGYPPLRWVAFTARVGHC